MKSAIKVEKKKTQKYTQPEKDEYTERSRDNQGRRDKDIDEWMNTNIIFLYVRSEEIVDLHIQNTEQQTWEYLHTV